MDDLIKVSEMIRKYPKALSLKDPSKKCSGHDRAHDGEFYGELVNDEYKLCAICNDCMNDLINRDYKQGYYEKDNAWNAIVLGQEDIKWCAKRYRDWIAGRCLKIKDQMAKMRDEMDKSRLKDDDGYTICRPLNGMGEYDDNRYSRIYSSAPVLRLMCDLLYAALENDDKEAVERFKNKIKNEINFLNRLVNSDLET